LPIIETNNLSINGQRPNKKVTDLKKNTQNPSMKKIIFILIFLILLFLTASYFKKPEVKEQRLKKFSSYQELKNFVNKSREMYFPYTQEALVTLAPTATTLKTGVLPTEYSATNIQVLGVDEADIVKTDGKYIYLVSGDSVNIIEAYPAENARTSSKIELNGTINGIFVNKDKLIIFVSEYHHPIFKGGLIREIYPYPNYQQKVFIYIYDISDKSNPKITRNVSLNGTYFDSRMIGDYVYVIVNEPLQYMGDDIILPSIVEGNKVKSVQAPEIYYSEIFDYSHIFTSVLAVNTQKDEEEVNSKVFLLGASQTIYVSSSNIYIVYPKSYSFYDFYDKLIDEAILPSLPSEIQDKIREIEGLNISQYEKLMNVEKVLRDYVESLGPEEAANFMKNLESKINAVMKEIDKELEKTFINKIALLDKNIEYKTSGEVPGRVLNQFSMDEYNNHFRIATTSGSWTSPFNNLYVLDEDLKIVGKIEDLAPTERIFATRFVGDKAYMVTFRRTDPLFVIDLADPLNPKVLGEVKLPGYSDYLHLYDDNHLIGIGKDADEQGRELGVKVSLFDVSDFSNPKEISKFTIGTSGTFSPASSDHKAFLFSKSKNLLVIPIYLAETPYNQTWQGAYVFSVGLDSGIVLKGRITHSEEQFKRYDEYNIQRALYIDDILYTISDKMVKMNDLHGLDEINKIVF
jgi:uncharacterized secreted protein with C-terminal beta-propeller domain